MDEAAKSDFFEGEDVDFVDNQFPLQNVGSAHIVQSLPKLFGELSMIWVPVSTKIVF